MVEAGQKAQELVNLENPLFPHKRFDLDPAAIQIAVAVAAAQYIGDVSYADVESAGVDALRTARWPVDCPCVTATILGQRAVTETSTTIRTVL